MCKGLSSRSRFPVLFLVLGATLLFHFHSTPSSGQTSDANQTRHVFRVQLTGRLDAGNHHLLTTAISSANSSPQQSIVLLEGNLSGGDLFHTLKAFEQLQNSRAPVLIYVNRRFDKITALLPFAADRLYFHPNGRINPGPMQHPPILPFQNDPLLQKKLNTLQQLFISRVKMAGCSEQLARGLVNPNSRTFPVRIKGQIKWISSKELEERKSNDKTRNVTELLNTKSIKRPFVLDEPLANSLNLSAGTASSTEILLRDYTDHTGGTDLKITSLRKGFLSTVITFSAGVIGMFFLLAPGLSFLWLEFTRPGIGLSGLVSGLLLGTYFVLRFTGGFWGGIELLILGVGIGLLLIEKFVFPGFGKVGTAGSICLLTTAFLSYHPFILPSGILFSHMLGRMLMNLLKLFLTTAAGLFLFYLLFTRVPGSLDLRWIPGGGRAHDSSTS